MLWQFFSDDVCTSRNVPAQGGSKLEAAIYEVEENLLLSVGVRTLGARQV